MKTYSIKIKILFLLLIGAILYFHTECVHAGQFFKQTTLPQGVYEIKMGITYEEFPKKATFSYDMNKPFGNEHWYDNKDEFVMESKNFYNYTNAAFHFNKNHNILYEIELTLPGKYSKDDYDKLVNKLTLEYSFKPKKYPEDYMFVSKWTDQTTEVTLLYIPNIKEVQHTFRLRSLPGK